MTATPDDEIDGSSRSRAAEPGELTDSDDTDATRSVRLRWRSTISRGAAVFVALVVLLALAAAGPVAADLPASDTTTPTEPLGSNAVTAEPTAGDTPSDHSDINGSFVRPTYTGVAGDTVEIKYNEIDEDRYLLIGGNRLTDTEGSVGYTDVVVLEAGTNNVTINTRLLGTAEGTDRTAEGTDSCQGNCEFIFEDGNTSQSLSDVPGATGAGGLARPIVPQRYRLAITNGTFVVEDSGVVTPVEAADSSDLLLTKPAFHDEVEVFTTADSDDIDGEADNESLSTLEQNGLDRTAVTKGDRVVLGFESTGIWGALSHFAGGESFRAGEEVDHAALMDLLNESEGVSLTVRQTNPGMNEPRSEFDPSEADAEDVSLFVADAEELDAGDSTPGRFYLVIDTSDGGPFTEDPEPGDEFAVEFALEGTEGQRYAFDSSADEPPPAFEPEPGAPEQFPYWETADGTVSAEASFTVQERYFRYDHVTDDEKLLVEASGGEVTGTTTTLPPIEMSATFVDDTRDEPFRSESELDISDGNFSLDADLGGADPGTRLNYELYEGTTLHGSRTVIVVDDVDDPDRLAIEDAPENVTVLEDGNLSALDVDVRNAGGLEGDGTLSLAVDNGTLTASRDLTLSGNESRTVAFPSATVRLDPGTYPYTVTLDGDRRNGTLTVTDDPAKTTIDDDGAESEGGNSTDGGSSADDGNSTDDGSEDASNPADNSSNPADNSSDPDSDPDDQDEEDGSSTLLPFGIGTRETLVGTLLVGAVHLLGHWV